MTDGRDDREAQDSQAEMGAGDRPSPPKPSARKRRKAVAARRRTGDVATHEGKDGPEGGGPVEGANREPGRRPVAKRARDRRRDNGSKQTSPKAAVPKSAAKAAGPRVKVAPTSDARQLNLLPPDETLPAEPSSVDANGADSGGADSSSSGRTLRASYRAGPAPENAQEGAVLVTGICGRMGHLLTRILHRDDHVVGVDRRPFDERPKDVVHHQVDVRRKKTRDIFRAGGIRAVVHLGVMHNPRASERDHHSWNVVAFQKLLEYIAQYGVSKLVVLSSANAYGPMPDNPQFLTEEAPLLGAQAFRNMRDLIELDMLAQSFFWRHPDTETVILRPCHILGRVRNAPSNYLRLERPVMLLGYDPMIQVIHERDVVRAIQRSLRPGIRGIFNLRGQGEVALSRVIALAGKTPRRVPSVLAELSVDRLWKYRMSSFPSAQLDYVKYVCMVDDTRAREVLGFEPRYTLDETVAAVTADR